MPNPRPPHLLFATLCTPSQNIASMDEFPGKSPALSGSARRTTLGCQELAELLRKVASPVEASLPSARRRTIDTAALADVIKAVDGAGASPSSENDSTIDASEFLALVKAATDGPLDASVPTERRQDIDVHSLQTVFDVLTMNSPGAARAAGSIALSSAKKGTSSVDLASAAAVGGEDVAPDASHTEGASDGEDDESAAAGRARRHTIDPSAFAELLALASSPASESVPEDRRLVVDADAMQGLVDLASQAGRCDAATADTGAAMEDGHNEGASDKQATASSRKRRATVDASEFYDLLRVALSPAALEGHPAAPSAAPAAASRADNEGDEEVAEESTNSGGSDEGARRQTIDPNAFADLLAGLSSWTPRAAATSAVKVNAAAMLGAAAVATAAAATPGADKARRLTVDGAAFGDMLRALATPNSANASAAATPASKKGGCKSSAKKTTTPKSRASSGGGGGSNKKAATSAGKGTAGSGRRMTVNADDMAALLLAVGEQSPNPSTPYVSPPVSARTRRGSKSPAAASATKASKATKITPKEGSSAGNNAASAKRRRAAVASPAKTTANNNNSSSSAVASPSTKRRAASPAPADNASDENNAAAAVSSPRDWLQTFGEAKSRPFVGTPTNAADVLASAFFPQDGASAAAVAAASTTHPVVPTSALKSCLSTRKAALGFSAVSSLQPTPSKSVLFGAPAAAEFRKADPATTLTPMHRDKAKAYFPMTTDSMEDSSMENAGDASMNDSSSLDSNTSFEAAADIHAGGSSPQGAAAAAETKKASSASRPSESLTKTNSRILAAWGDGNNVLNDAPNLTPRRLSGKFKLPEPKSLALDEAAGSSAPTSANGRNSSNKSASSSSSKNAANTSARSFQARMDSAAAEDDEVIQDENDGESPADLSGASWQRGQLAAGAMAGDQTEELEEDLGGLLRSRRSSVGGGAEGVAGRVSMGGEDRTVALEGGLGALMVGLGANRLSVGGGGHSSTAASTAAAEEAKAAIKKASGAPFAAAPMTAFALAPEEEDGTVELEGGLSALVQGLGQDDSPTSAKSADGSKHSFNGTAAASEGSGAASNKRGARLSLSANEDRTVELEGALADLVAGLGHDDDSSSDGPHHNDEPSHVWVPRLSLTPYQPPKPKPTSQCSAKAAAAALDFEQHNVEAASGAGVDLNASGVSARSATSHLSTRSAAASDAFGLLLEQAGGRRGGFGDHDDYDNGGLDLLESSCASSMPAPTPAGKARPTPVAAATVAAVAPGLPPHLSEFKELLSGLGLRPGQGAASGTSTAGSALFGTVAAPGGADATTPGVAAGAGVESEAVVAACDDLLSGVTDDAADAMAERLWAFARSLRGASSSGAAEPHFVEVLLRALREGSSTGNATNDEANAAVVAQASAVCGQVAEAARREWQAYEVELAGSVASRLGEATDSARADEETQARALGELTAMEAQCDQEAALADAAVRLASSLAASEEAAAQCHADTAAAGALEAELAEAEAEVAALQGRCDALAAVEHEALRLSDLQQQQVAQHALADAALGRYKVAAALRSWTPRHLGGGGNDDDEVDDVVVDFPLDLDGGDGACLTVAFSCSEEQAATTDDEDNENRNGRADVVESVDWTVREGAATTATAAGAAGGGASGPAPKRGKGKPWAPRLTAVPERPGSVLVPLRHRLVSEWVGREAGRVLARSSVASEGGDAQSEALLGGPSPYAMRDLPRVLNRFDALAGRLRLVLAEVRSIEDLGLDLALRDGSDGTADSGDEDGDEGEAEAGGARAGLWLQVPLSSAKHHCRVRLEARISDGFPWAPAEVRLCPLLGSPPPALTQLVSGLAHALLPDGAPLLAGAGALAATVAEAVKIMS